MCQDYASGLSASGQQKEKQVLRVRVKIGLSPNGILGEIGKLVLTCLCRGRIVKDAFSQNCCVAMARFLERRAFDL